MPGNFVSLGDAGFFDTAKMGNEAEQAFIQDAIQKQALAQQKIATQKAGAEAAPTIDPRAVAAAVAGEVARRQAEADARNAINQLSPELKVYAATHNGQLPESRTSTPSRNLDTGTTSLNVQTGIPIRDPNTGQVINRNIASDVTNTLAPIGSRVTINPENPKTPGITTSTEQPTAVNEKGEAVPFGAPTEKIERTGRSVWQNNAQNRMDAAMGVIMDPNASQEEKTKAALEYSTAQGLINAASATAPGAPKNTKPPAQSEWRQNQAQIDELATSMEGMDQNSPEYAKAQAQLDALQKRQASVKISGQPKTSATDTLLAAIQAKKNGAGNAQPATGTQGGSGTAPGNGPSSRTGTFSNPPPNPASPAQPLPQTSAPAKEEGGLTDFGANYKSTDQVVADYNAKKITWDQAAAVLKKRFNVGD